MKEALKLALEALGSAKELAGKHDYELEYGFQHTITAIKEALAQPERPWVGLTDEEIEDCMEMSIQKTCRAIEAKLKEKNT